MKLATLALTTALVFTGSYALAQSTGGSSASGSSATGSTATSSTTTGSSAPGTTTGNATGTNPGTGMTNNAGSAAAAQNSAEPVGEHASQSVAQRFDVDTGNTRLVTRQIKTGR